MAKKRTLKDVAATPLVKKTAISIPQAGDLDKQAARISAPRKGSRPRPAKLPASLPKRLDAAVPAVAAKPSLYGSLARMAASILIGFVGGFFFGRFFKIV